MFSLTIPKNVLTDSQQAAKQFVCSGSIVKGSDKHNYITRCDTAMKKHLGIKDGKLELELDSSLIFSDQFSLSMGYGQMLSLCDDSSDIQPHLRLYSDAPLYIDFQVSKLLEPWQKLWGIAMARLLSALRGVCCNSISYTFSDEEMIIKALKQDKPLSKREYERVMESYVDELDDDDYESFIEFVAEYQSFLKALYICDPNDSWAAFADLVNEELATELNTIITAIEKATLDMQEANVPQLIIDECRSTNTIYTILLTSNEIEYEVIQSNWQYYCEDPSPVAIGLIPSKESDIKAYLKAFMERSILLENLIGFFNKISG
ncbi:MULTISPECIES: hypothetical protein [Vibrio]|uniref:hypothetical protein n=1 Tax=Vibrio TaxID=662 RepID=UPI00078E0CE4|nr:MULTISPECIES: hypothetical protein [Vibrio]BAU70939.1 hypothetical protein [Vibrio sp. 04Ya108]BBM67803.1 hypothetical protein VA249_44490 [Vibrio alfacsensis]BCN26974.1 hypothetical protein VYA_41660 [Vibrio alfacsensis]